MSRHATECGRGKPFRPSNRNICRTMAVFVRQKRAISSAYDRSSLGGVESDLHTTCARETASRRRRPSRREFARHTKCCVDSPSPIPCALRRVCRWESARTGRDFVATYFSCNTYGQFARISSSPLARSVCRRALWKSVVPLSRRRCSRESFQVAAWSPWGAQIARHDQRGRLLSIS